MNYRSLLIVCLATLGLAVAGWGQADGKIAFTSYRENNNDVWIMNADGSDPVNLTQGRHRHCSYPSWSPDGTKIAYVDVGAYSSSYIWVMDADGGNPRQLTDDLGLWWYELVWADDGSSMYYYVRNPPEVFAVALDGSGSSPVDWREGAWIARRIERARSPDGTKRATVVLQDEEGAARLRLVLFNPNASEHPDASEIVDFREVLLPDLPYQQAELEPGWERMAHPNPTWSPDSRRIAFSAASDQGAEEVWVVDIDGSNLVELTNGLGGDSPAWQPAEPAVATSVESQSWGRIKALLAAP